MNSEQVPSPEEGNTLTQDPRSPFSQVSSEFMTAVVRMEEATKIRRWDIALQHACMALRAQAALTAVMTQTIGIAVGEIKAQDEIILQLRERVEDLEGRMGNVGRGLESIANKVDDLKFPEEESTPS